MAENCKICDCELVGGIPEHFCEYSYDISNWLICHDCMVEYCCQTNCLMCKYGKYPDCRFLDMKRYHMSKE